jgi:hypothetical protein
LCSEHAAALQEMHQAGEDEREAEEDEGERRERVASELRAKLTAWTSVSKELMEASPSQVDAQRRLQAERAEQKRVAAERTRRWIAERAEDKRLAEEGSARPGVQRMLEDRRLEATIAKRRWNQKAAWRKKTDPPPGDSRS